MPASSLRAPHALPAVAAMALAGCWGNKDLSYPPGLEPLETNVAPWPEGSADEPYPEALELVSGEGDLLWAHGRGYVHAPLATTWEALRQLDVDVDRRRVAEWSWTWDVPQDYDYCYRIHVLVQDLIDLEWDIDWHHGVVNGDLGDPEAVGIRFFKSEGTSLIDLQAGSISAFRIDDETTAIELIEQLDAPATGEEDLTQYLSDLFDDTVAFSHGRPLPEYPEE
ncbi:MAG: hypothetical protein ABIO70_36390 [Pseudomonadota bacterium]